MTGPQPQSIRTSGAVGLYVAGQGLYVSRQEALVRLGPLPTGACGSLQQCPYEVFVSVPPLGSSPNRRRYDVTIRGGDYRGILVSDRTRIPGLVTIGDIRDGVSALERGGDVPIEWRASERPLQELAELDRRLHDAREAQLPATVALALMLIALAVGAYVTRWRLLARTAVLYPLAAILAALAASAIGQVGPVATTAVVLAAAAVALLAAAFVPLTLAVPVGVGAYGIALAISPETNSLMAIGPHPWSGGRFHGVTNQVSTLLLAPLLAAGSLLRGAQLLALAALAIVVVGASVTGADGGGLVVLAAAFVALWLLLERRRAAPLAVLVIAAVAVGFVALDAATGGSSHVVDALFDGPRELLRTLERRAETSVAIATSSAWQLAALLASVATLSWLAALRPRFPAVDALLVAVAVSLVVNDAPTKVAGFGAVVAVALRAWSVSIDRRPGIESS